MKNLSVLYINESLFWSRVTRTDGCWVWDSPMKNGYGQFWVGRKADGTRTRAMAHRVAYTIAYGSIPEGMSIDHLCRNHACVNPDHLEPVTTVENVMRGEGPFAENARKEVCPLGHAFDAGNTYWYKGARQCRECRRQRNREHAKRIAADPAKHERRLQLAREAYRRRR